MAASSNVEMVRLRRRTQSLLVSNFGPIRSANVEFGDLTVLVGPQATGKSIFLQLLKLLIDLPNIKYEFRRAGIDWENNLLSFLDVYFGEGMRSLWEPEKTRIVYNRIINLPEFVQAERPRKGESMFFIPAQRVLALRDGWPQAFSYYDPGVPYAVREFSEQLRLLISGFVTSGPLFPAPRRLKDEFRELLQQHIFPGFELRIDTQRAQKRLVLSARGRQNGLPFVVWSAGQREFVPLLLGLYWLMTPAKTPRRKGLKWAVIEELEMGLHPRAIAVVVLMIFELVARGYQVLLSTHSPQVLDAVWAVKHLKEAGADPKTLLKVFDTPASPLMVTLATKIMKTGTKVYYFDREGGTTKDISALDANAGDASESGWGGLSEFSGRANEEVARAVANADRTKS
jgi:hypothetical protein